MLWEDNYFSLLPGEFGDMVRAIREVEEAMGTDKPRSVTQGELMNREVLAKSIVAARPIAEGQVIGEDDLELLWQALENMFEHDRSAARGEMATRGLYVFKHDSELGNAPAHELFKRISAKAATEIPRNFVDYKVTVNDADMPAGVSLIRRVG